METLLGAVMARRSRFFHWARRGLLVVGLLGALNLFSLPPYSPNALATGWVLAHKLRHDPQRLERLIEQQPTAERELLMQGIGWGCHRHRAQSLNNSPSVPAQLTALLAGYSPPYPDALRQGLCRAFQPGVTPVLDPTRLVALKALLNLPATFCPSL
jgi:hypothetical protein